MRRVILGTLRSRLAQIALDRGGLVVAAALALYLVIAPSHIADGESAHFATLGAFGGAAHPSGYPLYVLWLRVTSWLPLGSAVHTAAIATVLLAAAQLAILHAACRAWGASATAASVAVAIFAGAPIVIGSYTEPEVFALNGLAVALVLWLAAAAGPLRGGWRCAALGLVAGLGLANHMTCALVAPIGLLGIVRGVREAQRKPLAAAVTLLGLAVGLAPYAYLVAAPTNAASWGRIEGFGDVMAIVLRHEYGGPGAFQAIGGPVPVSTSLVSLLETLGRTWLWVPAVGGLAVFVVRAVRPSTAGEPRAGWAMLLASFVLAGPVLVARFNVEPVGVGRYLVMRFHVLPALLLAIPIAEVLDRVGSRLPRLRPATIGLVIVLGFAAVAGSAVPHVLHVHSPAVEQEVRNTLASLPPGAVVIGDSDDLAGGITYVQLALGERPDVVYVHWPLMVVTWYRDRLVPRGIVADTSVGGVSSIQITRDLLAQGRAVFVQPSKANLVDAFPHYPYGVLMRVLPVDAPAPSIDEIVAINKRVYGAFQLGYQLPGPDDEWPAEVHKKYAWTWEVLAHALERAGKLDDAAWAHEAAREIGPQP